MKPRTPYDTLLYWIAERQRIYERRLLAFPKPWTHDPILLQYRFCNVYREQDTVTQWIAGHWRNPYSTDPDLWFAMCIARLFNWPPTLDAMGYPVPYRPKHLRDVVHGLKDAGDKVFSGAYIVSTNGVKMDKTDYLLDRVLAPLWAARADVRPIVGDTLDSSHQRLSQHIGMGSFLAAQVVADLKYVRPLSKAVDWHTWASSGPGSRRGLNRVLGRPTDAPWREHDWRRELGVLQAKVNADLKRSLPEPLHAQDLQNCLCEVDKYLRVLNDEGRPRSTYPGNP
jgi:hypothetical protein